MRQYTRHLQATLTLCVLLCIALGLAVPTRSASTAVSITVDYVYDEQPLEDVEVEIYLIATWVNGQYQLTDDFHDLNVDFSDLSTPSDWRDDGETVEDYIEDERCTCADCLSTDGTGSATFHSLTYGIYYVDVADADYGDGTLISSPVLVTLPSYDTTAGEYIYHVTMTPKVAYDETPEVPTIPTEPDDPDEPDEPDIPDIPEIPDIPDEPEIPDDPDDPDTPYHPGDPDDPNIPELPYDPDIPVFPLDPDVPRSPGFPFDPDIPQTGSYRWLVAPLAGLGVLLLLFGIWGVPTGRKRHED